MMPIDSLGEFGIQCLDSPDIFGFGAKISFKRSTSSDFLIHILFNALEILVRVPPGSKLFQRVHFPRVRREYLALASKAN